MWNETKKFIFSANIQNIDKLNFTKSLYDTSINSNLSDSQKIDQMVNNFKTVLHTAALKNNSFGRKGKKKADQEENMV